MPTIKNFTTKKDVLKQLEDAGATIKLGFEATSEFEVKENPFSGHKVESHDGKEQDIKVV